MKGKNTQKKAEDYANKKHPALTVTTEKLRELGTLIQSLQKNQDEAKLINGAIANLHMPSLIIDFCEKHPELQVTSVTDKLCSVMCLADKINTMPYGASNVEIEDDKIKFKVLLD